MTSLVEIANRALAVPGTRTTVTAVELANNETNEAIQINLVQDSIRKLLLRMAPWKMALKTDNLVYISSAPGTPENLSAPTLLWERGQPQPPWAYEYQYPVDCLRACWVIPATQTGFAGGIPITTAVTGGAASFWQGPPVKFVVHNDQFYSLNSATVVSGGSGYVLGDTITLVSGLNTDPPIGAPAQFLVTGVTAGAVTTVEPINVALGEDPPLAGSYFRRSDLINPIAQGSTNGVGIGATFDVTSVGPAPQRVILCNQEFATLVYCQDVTDPNIMDDMFQDAWAKLLGAHLVISLTGDKKLANLAIQSANAIISEARTYDGNEGFTVNNVTPDWIRERGIAIATPYSGPYTGFEWGTMWPVFG